MAPDVSLHNNKKAPLVCVFAHPDDESFGPGGSIAKFAKERDVHIICATSGDADPQFTNHDHTELGNIRERELLAAAKILGVKYVDFLRFKDGSLCNNNYHKLADKIKEKIDQYKPSTVLTFDFSGVSGHLDHVAVAMITSFVVQKLDYVEETLYYCENEEIIKQWRKDYFVYVPRGYNKSQVDLVVDFSQEWEATVQAMLAHKSQVDDANIILSIMEKFPKEQFFIRVPNK